jgi:hypothetical protein
VRAADGPKSVRIPRPKVHAFSADKFYERKVARLPAPPYRTGTRSASGAEAPFCASSSEAQRGAVFRAAIQDRNSQCKRRGSPVCACSSEAQRGAVFRAAIQDRNSQCKRRGSPVLRVFLRSTNTATNLCESMNAASPIRFLPPPAARPNHNASRWIPPKPRASPAPRGRTTWICLHSPDGFRKPCSPRPRNRPRA